MDHSKTNKDEDLCNEKDVFYKQDVYEITINPSDQGRRSKVAAKAMIVNMHSMMKDMHAYARLELYLEISEPRWGNVHRGSEPRWHFHGFLEVLDPIEFIVKGIPMLKKSSDYCINKLRLQEWSNYVDKQQSLIVLYLQQYDNQMLIEYPLSNTTRKMKVVTKTPTQALPSVRHASRRGTAQAEPTLSGKSVSSAKRS